LSDISLSEPDLLGEFDDRFAEPCVAGITIEPGMPDCLKGKAWIALQELRGREGSDVAETFLYLIKSGFTTGQIVVIDGGALIA
jgi:hypothetical protein